MTITGSDATADAPDEDVAIRLRDTSVYFGMDCGRSMVLNEGDADIRRSEVLGVIGESGSGKSMFASALLDAVPEPGVTTGEITYYPEEGEPVPVTDLSKEELRSLRWEEISMVLQGAMSSFNPHFVETLSAHDYNVDRGIERVKDLLADLYLDPERMLESYPHELLGGMKQRVLIALSCKPELIDVGEDASQPTACFRAQDDPEYWESKSITDDAS